MKEFVYNPSDAYISKILVKRKRKNNLETEAVTEVKLYSSSKKIGYNYYQCNLAAIVRISYDNKEKFFGYRKYYAQEKFDAAIKHLYEDRIYKCMKEKGLSAIIYTEVSDVEDELNGLLTYDREVIKVSPEMMKAANEKLKL